MFYRGIRWRYCRHSGIAQLNQTLTAAYHVCRVGETGRPPANKPSTASGSRSGGPATPFFPTCHHFTRFSPAFSFW